MNPSLKKMHEKSSVLFTFFCFVLCANCLDLVPDCDQDKRQAFACYFQEHWTDKEHLATFCLLNNFDCIVADPAKFASETCSNENEPELSWKCYERPMEPLKFSLHPNQTNVTITEETWSLKLEYFSSFPRPFSKILTESQDIIMPTIATNSSSFSQEVYEIPVNQSSTFILRIYQPGFASHEQMDFYVSTMETSESNLIIILCVTIPAGLGLILALVFVYVCFKKRLFCFNNQGQNTATNERQFDFQATNSINTIHQANSVNSRQNQGFIDDSNFTEIDLNEAQNPQNNHYSSSPMTSYIASVAAR